MSTNRKQETSESTSVKGNHFRAVAQMHAAMCGGIIDRTISTTWGRDAYSDEYTYLDLFAGCGLNMTARGPVDGSPLAMARMCIKENLKARGYLFEINPKTADELEKRMALLPSFRVVRGDNKKTIDIALSEIAADGKKRYGMVYCDPNGSLLPVPELRRIFALPEMENMDLVCYVAANTYKRARGAAPACHWEQGKEYSLIADLNAIGKRKMILRVPENGHQWTIAICTNWEKFPVWTKKGFRDAGSADGIEIIKYLTFNESEQVSIGWRKPDWMRQMQEIYRALRGTEFVAPVTIQSTLELEGC